MGVSKPDGDLDEPFDLQSLRKVFSAGVEGEAETAVAALVSLGSLAVAYLEELLADQHADVRWWAVRALAEVEVEGAGLESLLLRALDDPEPAIRQCGALALRVRPCAEAIGALQNALESDDRLMARLAADALAAIGPPATAALLESLQSGSQQARVEAIRALAMSDDPKAVPALFAALDDDSPMIEYWADHGLQRRGIGMTFFKL